MQCWLCDALHSFHRGNTPQSVRCPSLNDVLRHSSKQCDRTGFARLRESRNAVLVARRKVLALEPKFRLVMAGWLGSPCLLSYPLLRRLIRPTLNAGLVGRPQRLGHEPLWAWQGGIGRVTNYPK